MFESNKKIRTASPQTSTVATKVRFGDVAFTNVTITNKNLSVNQIAIGRVRENYPLYKVIKNGEVIVPASEKIGENSEVDILFDYTDRFDASKK